jgi:hypothetical protein
LFDRALLATVALAILTATPVPAATLRVVSELTRYAPDGQVLTQDRGGEPRAILSPGVARNAHASFRIVVSFDKPEEFTLDVGQNPENAVQVKLYDERGGGFKETPLPVKSRGEKTVTFWMDIWVDKNAPVDRIKVEPQLYINSEADWYTYPMEVRILEAVPDVRPASARIPGPAAPSDHAAFGPLRATLCGKPEPAGAAGPASAQALIRRNAVEHMALAKIAAARAGRDVLLDAFMKASGEQSPAKWCAAPFTPRHGPEWYLRLRDAVLRTWPQ